MDKRIKKMWVNALRSGEYKQTTDALRVSGRFCCLGVLCNLHAIEHPEIAKKQRKARIYLDEEEQLPYQVRTWAGLPHDLGADVEIGGRTQSLAGHNDEGMTFRQIADAIEAQL